VNRTALAARLPPGPRHKVVHVATRDPRDAPPEAPLVGTGRGGKRVCGGCGANGHRRSACPVMKAVSEAPRLGPRVVPSPGMVFRVIEDFAEAGGKLAADSEWMAVRAARGGAWQMRPAGGGRARTLRPDLYPVQPVPGPGGPAGAFRVGFGRPDADT
jgi:hypothetical protein